MQIVFSPEAKLEIESAFTFYERQAPGLGVRFKIEMVETLRRLRQWPLSAPVERDEIHRMLLSRSPYKYFTRLKAAICKSSQSHIYIAHQTIGLNE